MSKDKLNDENFGTRDKRGNWKPFGTISINPPLEIFYNPKFKQQTPIVIISCLSIVL